MEHLQAGGLNHKLICKVKVQHWNSFSAYVMQSQVQRRLVQGFWRQKCQFPGGLPEPKQSAQRFQRNHWDKHNWGHSFLVRQRCEEGSQFFQDCSCAWLDLSCHFDTTAAIELGHRLNRTRKLRRANRKMEWPDASIQALLPVYEAAFTI